MGALVAVVSKKGQDVTKTVMDMLETSASWRSRVYGIAASSTSKEEECFEFLREFRLDSPIAVGYAFSRTFLKDRPHHLRLDDSTAIFDGRIYGADAEKFDAQTTVKKLGRNLEKAALMFMKKADGDFVFAAATPEAIVAGRDVLGVRPLYWGENRDFAVISSERKTLWRIGIKEARSFPPGCVSLIGSHGFKFFVAKRIIRSRPKEITMQQAANKLQTLLEDSVKKRVSGLKEVAVAFSAGLDSSIIASLARSCANVILIHVSLKNGSEVEFAKQTAEELRLPLHLFLYDGNDVQKAIPKVVGIIEESDPVKVSIGIPFYWAAEKTASLDCNVMLAGQGADELFGGYRRYLDDYLHGNDDRVEDAIFNDIVGLYEANLERDSKICNYFDVELRLPFAVARIANFAISLPLELKMERTDNTLRKLVLRHVAKSLGLPQPVVDRPKKAIQYATGTNEAIKTIAKRRGLSTAEYLRKVFQAVFKDVRN